ncbi:MAG: helix-hairpin-helix domain-containing protein [Bacteroidales bacterium]|nr:helix-hairpin-helix domain-containing protein [Bacteroidales bacterium]
MIRQIRVIIIILFILSSFQGRAGVRPSFSLDDIILDIYNAVTEFGEVDYEQLQTDLYALHESPIDLNNTSDEELTQLYFLSPQQIDAILAYAYRHPFESLYELRLIPELADYEIRDLLPFVYINRDALNSETINTDALYAKEIFAKAHHELLTRIDARHIEAYEGTDPIYTQFRYRFDFRRRVTFGVQLRRPAGGFARDLQYGAYLQLNNITPHLHTLVAGNFQASFGQGLVLAPVFHAGKSMYVTSVGQQREGLRYYSSVDGQGLHGAGATLRWEWNKTTRLDVSALYSMRRANDSTWHHLLGANLTLRHKKLQVELTAIENLWSDSIHPYTNAKYNRHYFRGRNQAVIGASFRYNHGWFDMFGEVATAQNHQITNDQSPITKSHWGFGTIIGSRFYPTNGFSLLALYRYYSPYFDNALGYAFSETSRLGDENGGYLGFDITRLRNWRFIGYGDIFYFSGYKYGLGDATRTLGYDAMAEIQYSWSKHPSFQGGDGGRLSLRLRARQKGDATYSTRAQFDWAQGSWSLRTTAEANIIPSKLSTLNSQLTYGFTIFQDISYSLPLREGRGLGFRLRLQGFDAREWANRIYTYEHDVLYAYSIPAVYGLGGRAYLCLRWQIIPQLALYFRASETVYARKWAAAHSRPLTRTDLHLLLRATF